MAGVRRDDHGAVAVLTLDRAERRNALSADLVEALHLALTEVESDPQVRVVVLAAAGKTFCAGGDLAGGMTGGGVVEGHRGRGRYAELLGRMTKSPLPLIAAVQGDALGGGLGLVLACDLALAAPTARLGTPEVRLGLFPWIILALLQRHVGRKALMEMVLGGEKLPAPRALELGMLNRVAQSDDVLGEALQWAQDIAGRAPLAVSMGKQAFAAVADLPLDDAMRYLHTQLTLNLMTEDAMEGLAAFLQKRDPQWKGR